MANNKILLQLHNLKRMYSCNYCRLWAVPFYSSLLSKQRWYCSHISVQITRLFLQVSTDWFTHVRMAVCGWSLPLIAEQLIACRCWKFEGLPGRGVGRRQIICFFKLYTWWAISAVLISLILPEHPAPVSFAGFSLGRLWTEILTGKAACQKGALAKIFEKESRYVYNSS